MHDLYALRVVSIRPADSRLGLGLLEGGALGQPILQSQECFSSWCVDAFALIRISTSDYAVQFFGSSVIATSNITLSIRPNSFTDQAGYINVAAFNGLDSLTFNVNPPKKKLQPRILKPTPVPVSASTALFRR